MTSRTDRSPAGCEEVVIIGAGPAGIAAAIQLHRQGSRPLIFEREAIGGLLRNAHRVENYPGFATPLSGPDLVARLRDHLARYQARVRAEEVTSLDREADGFLVQTARDTLPARIAVVASGTQPQPLTDVAVEAGAGERIVREVHPLRKVQGKEIVVVGGGDAAFDYALTLADGNRVRILHRSPAPRCLPLLCERARAHAAIAREAGASLTRVAAAPDGGLILRGTGRHGPFELHADYLIPAIGREPATGFLSARVRAEAARLTAQGDLHFIGDVRGGIFRQVAIAAGQGIEAAMKIAERLRENPECTS